tara:strand:+ start:504 stop:884 length:381 start_codon:yes stop_codon:yes gene_type:complete
MKNKIIGFLFVAVMISGCANVKDYVPENFDGNEYMKLAELSVLSGLSESCNGMEMASMRFNSAVLMKYSEGTLKENIAEIYAGIHDLTVELTERENPSAAYCKIKRGNITKLVDEAMDTFGDRKKS